MRKIKFILSSFAAVLICTVALAQNITVKGTVTDASTGEGIPFASVMLKGTMSGTATDADGVYSITVPANGTLVFTYVGYNDLEVAVNGKADIDAMLQPSAESLDDVVVVAYGVQKKSSFVGSASQISGEKLKKMQTTNITKSLEGAVAGLQTASSSGTPGAGASIQIRGFGSINASTAPLIVVDGTPYEGSLNSIPSSDIESLTVLKDAAANSMYGARGSNGVIIITTKRGTSGKVNVTLDAKVGFNSRGVPEYEIIKNPADYYEMTWESIRNSMLYSGGMSYAQAGLFASNNLMSEDYGLYNIYKGIADYAVIDATTGQITPGCQNLKWTDDWTKDVFRKGLRQEYTVTASGGSDKTQGYLSVSYLDDKGYVAQSGFRRISLRGKVDQQIGKRIKVGINVAYANTDMQQYNDSEGNNYSNLFLFTQMIAPIYPIYLYDRNTGERKYDEHGNALYDWGEDGRAFAPGANPYGQLMTSEARTINDNISSRGYFNLNILDDLVFSVNAAFDVFNTKENSFTTPAGGDAKGVNGRGVQEMDRYTALNTNQLLTWSPKFGEHSLNVLVGHEIKKDNSYYLYGHMTNFVDMTNFDFSNAVVYQDLTSATGGYFLEGVFGRAEYNYASKYFLSASYRRDGSSRFAPEKRWGSFWAVGASWNIKQENFMATADWVNNLRIKASYGTQGNDNIGYTIVYDNLYRIDRVEGEASLTKTFRAAPDVTWEKSNNFNVGLEAKLFDRVNFNVEYFIKETKDMIYSRPLAASQGSPSSQLVNDMDMMNKGVEFEISADIIKNRDITWGVSLNGTHYKNQITKLPSDYPAEGKQVGSFWREVGAPIYNYYLYEWAGVDPQTGVALYNKYLKDEKGKETGEVEKVDATSKATYHKIGKTPIPDLYGGFGTTLNAYGIDFSATFAYQIGGWTLDSVYQSLMSSGSTGDNWHKDIFTRWTPQNTVTDVPRVQNNIQGANETSTRFLIKSSYISLRNVTLGYTLPSKISSKIGMEALRFYINGDNVWYASKRKGMDVRKSFSGGNGQTYSALRTLSAGITLTF